VGPSLNGWRKPLAAILLPLAAGCSAPPLQEYGLAVPAQTLGVVGAPPVRDGRARFRAIFCTLLERQASGQEAWGGCEELLHRLVDEPAALPRPVAVEKSGPPLRLIIVPGLLGECVGKIAWPYEQASRRLGELGYRVELLPVSGGGSSGFNAQGIAAAIRDLDLEPRERLVLLGHSKGAVDILEFLVAYPELRPRVAAVVSVAGAVNGSPLTGLFSEDFARWLGLFPQEWCRMGDAGALESLRRSTRLKWLADHPLPEDVGYFSLAAFTSREQTAPLLQPAHEALYRVDPRNDGQLLFSDQVIPGAQLLGYANADHWAVALPLRNDWPAQVGEPGRPGDVPRDLLLEAILLFVAEQLDAEDGSLRQGR